MDDAPGISTSPPRGAKSWASWLASLSEAEREAFVEGLSGEAAACLPWLFDVWGLRAHQMPPRGDWRTWVIMGGRGAGKTRAGAEWIRARAEGGTPMSPGPCRRIALVGETFDEAREVMVEGPSGIRACSPPDRRPVYEATRRRLVWPNGAEARIFSAQDPEALRGPQFDAAWADELGKWAKAEAVWTQLQFGLRLGARPRQVVTTTPRRTPILLDLIARQDTALTRASMTENEANLAPDFVEAVRREYGGTGLGRQEIDGEMLDEEPGAYWTRAGLESCRGRPPAEFARIVVAVDPPATSGPDADECGIVVAGIEPGGVEARIWVLADLSARGLTPQRWAERAVEAWRTWEADLIVAEVNQGGEMVGALVRQVEPGVGYKAVSATRSKQARAEPVSIAYHHGRIRHGGMFPELEDQMCTFNGARSEGSPDRVDALVWAATELMNGPGPRREPRVRRL